MTVARALAREILQAGLDDWVPLAAVEGIARRHGDLSDEDIRDSSIEAIMQLAIDGLVEIGEVSDGGFFEWNETLDAALKRVRKMWETAGPNSWGFAVWISNTPAGDEEAAVSQHPPRRKSPSSSKTWVRLSRSDDPSGL